MREVRCTRFLGSALFILLYLRLSSGEEPEYKYVFYDGDEVDYSQSQDNDTYYELNQEYNYGDYYDYEYQEKEESDIVDQAKEEYEKADEDKQFEDPEDVKSPEGEMEDDVVESEDSLTDEAIDSNTDTNPTIQTENQIEASEAEGQDQVQDVEEEIRYTEEVNNEETTEETTNEETTDEAYEETTDEAYEDYEENEDEYVEETEESESDYEEEDEDMDTLYRNYEILSAFYQKYYVDLRILDVSCDPQSFPAPTINNGRVVKYDEVDNVLLPKKKYMQAVYECDQGYLISTRTSDSMFCQDYTWTGLEPECERNEAEDLQVRIPELTGSEASDCPDDSGCPQECRMEAGYPECFCSSGFVLMEDDCVDVDECEKDNGGCEEECHNKPGSYICSCPSGYELSEDAHTCVDTNECRANNGHGPCQDTCVNVDGYYYCDCSGIPGTRLSEDRHSCQVVDLCLEDNGGCSHSCFSQYGQAFCSCPDGFELGDDWKTCRDINECRTVEGVCRGECFNTVGSYSCGYSCPDQHVYVEGECVLDCGEGEEEVEGRCLPSCGAGYTRAEGDCVRECKSGYVLVDNKCVLDCRQGSVLRDGVCHQICGPDVCGQGVCEVEGTGYRCVCDEGYVFSGGSCADLDECARGQDLCPLGQCVNTEGSYYCHCLDGYRNVDGVCVDVNECEEGVVCSQECINTEGSYECGCWEGYTPISGSGGACSDIDECTLRPAICQQGCNNLAGGFECACHQGFTKHPEDSTKCVPSGCQPLDAPDNGKLTCTAGPLQAGSVCRLVCKRGYVKMGKLSRTCLEDGSWEDGAGWCAESSCPAYPPLDHGDVSPEACLESSSRFKQRCKMSCQPGYTLHGSQFSICGKRGRWINRQGTPRCEPEATEPPPPVDQVSPPPPRIPTTRPANHISPYIICPPDILVNLTKTAPFQISIPSPKTNVDWESGVTSDPDWAKALSFPVSPGTLNIKFSATHHSSSHTATCKMTIRTVDTLPPEVKNCPNSFTVFLEKGEDTKKVDWEEPVFTDNVGVSSVLASQLPGQQLGLGRHVVIYQALDAEGNRERCVFSIRVARLSADVGPSGSNRRVWVLCRVGNTGRQIRLLVTRVPSGCRKINIRP